MSDEDLEELCEVFAGMDSLRKLNLGRNLFTARGMEALAGALAGKKRLELLKVSFSNVGDEGANVLLRRLGEENCPLRSLSMMGAKMRTKETIDQLVKLCLTKLDTLRELELKMNAFRKEDKVLLRESLPANFTSILTI